MQASRLVQPHSSISLVIYSSSTRMVSAGPSCECVVMYCKVVQVLIV